MDKELEDLFDEAEADIDSLKQRLLAEQKEAEKELDSLISRMPTGYFKKIKVVAQSYLTARDRKYLPIALEYCLTNGVNECTVNQKLFSFDFSTQSGYVTNYKGSWKDSCKSRFTWL